GNKMNMPGFTAQASLYKTSTRYQMRGTALQANGAIHPAFVICIPWCVKVGKFYLCYKICKYIPDPIYDPWKIGPEPDLGLEPSPHLWTPGSGLSTGGVGFD